MLVANSRAMQRVMAVLQRFAATDAIVVLEGETGTGKSCAARFIHDHSARADSPFVVVDCASLPASVIDSHLFGHERGAFTGAHASHEGLFEAARGGTIFLDEIGELPLELQTKLLGVIEERAIVRVGGTRLINVDVRIIAATHRDLRAAAERGEFRCDLLHRIDVLRAVMPPLRERFEDLAGLAQVFYERAVGYPDAVIPDALWASLQNCRWPGNVRELRNVIERYVCLQETDLPETIVESEPVTECEPERRAFDPTTTYGEAKQRMIERWEQLYVDELMHHTRGNLSRAAIAAGMNRTHLQRVLQRHGKRRC